MVPHSSFHKAKKWRFDRGRFSSICKPSGPCPFIMRIEISWRHISSTFEAKLLAKENSLGLFWRKITEGLLSSNGGFYTHSKLVLFWLLVPIVRDSVITLSAIAYNVNNNLDEVLLAIVCTVYNGNIFNRSRFFLKVNTVETLYPRACGGEDMLKRILKVSILFPHLLLNTVFLCKK